jgi:hypothetical protein
VKKRDVKFLKKIGDGMLETYPNFQKNQYYRTGYDAEQKRMAALNLKSPRLCIIYFDLLNFYRKNIRRNR